MALKYPVIGVLLLVILLMLTSCDLSAPDMALRVVNSSLSQPGGGGTAIQITFQLYNDGSERLEDCKVRWYVDGNNNNLVDYTDITGWIPAGGVSLGVGRTSSVYTVTTSSNYANIDAVEYFGIYEMGWDYSE